MADAVTTTIPEPAKPAEAAPNTFSNLLTAGADALKAVQEKAEALKKAAVDDIKKKVEAKPAVKAFLESQGIDLNSTESSKLTPAQISLMAKVIANPAKLDAFLTEAEASLNAKGLGDVMKKQPKFSTFLTAIANNENTPPEMAGKLQGMSGDAKGMDNTALLSYLFDHPEAATKMRQIVESDPKLQNLLTEIANGKSDCTSQDLLNMAMSKSIAPFMKSMGEVLTASGDTNKAVGTVLTDGAHALETYQDKERKFLVLSDQMVGQYIATSSDSMLGGLVAMLRPMIVHFVAGLVKTMQSSFGIEDQTIQSVADQMESGVSPTQIAANAVGFGDKQAAPQTQPAPAKS